MNSARHVEAGERLRAAELPSCPYRCPAKMPGHGWYWRFLARGKEIQFGVHRFLCPQCGHTVSVCLWLG